jgi:hypothetical protein
LAPLIWLSWGVGIRFDIGQATIEGDPIFDSLPLTQEFEILQRAWMSEIVCPWNLTGHEVELGVCVFTLRNLLHRAFHVACTAKRHRLSPEYNEEMEIEVQRLCAELNHDLEEWFSRSLIQQAKAKEQSQNDISSVSEGRRFLHYPPLPIHNYGYRKLMSDYATAKLYTSFVASPVLGPGPPKSRRFEHAIELCRTMATARVGDKCGHLLDGSRLFQLFLCRLVFGGDEYYPLETRQVMEMFEEALPKSWGLSVQEIWDLWIRNFPGLEEWNEHTKEREGNGSSGVIGLIKLKYPGMDLPERSL